MRFIQMTRDDEAIWLRLKDKILQILQNSENWAPGQVSEEKGLFRLGSSEWGARYCAPLVIASYPEKMLKIAIEAFDGDFEMFANPIRCGHMIGCTGWKVDVDGVKMHESPAAYASLNLFEHIGFPYVIVVRGDGAGGDSLVRRSAEEQIQYLINDGQERENDENEEDTTMDLAALTEALTAWTPADPE